MTSLPKAVTARPSLAAATRPTPYPPERWPIAAAQLQLPPQSTTATVDDWMRGLDPIVGAGFDAVELSSSWLRLGDVDPARLAEFRTALDEAGISVPGVSVVRESVIHPEAGERNLAFSHRTIDAAAAMGSPVVCVGLHDVLLPEQLDALWFWSVPGAPMDPEARPLAVARFRELAQHASEVGLELTLELYEDTFLGTADEALRLLADIDHDAVGLNPDLGNLVRMQRPIDSWEYMAATTLPHANYWHAKNYLRMEHPSGVVLTHPATLETGVMDYRRLVAFAIGTGFHGAFVVEHYGGDGLSVGATNREYLRRILPR